MAPSAAPAPIDGVHLVDEQDQVLGGADLVDHGLQPLLELAAVLRPGDHPRQVEGDDPLVGQRLRHLVVDDSLGDPLDDRRLADTGLAEQRGIVLRTPREDLDRLVDLVRSADHGVELALARLGGQVAAELVELRRLRGLLRRAALDAADHGAAKLRVRGAEALEQIAGGRLGVAGQCQEHVLGPDVRAPELAGFLVGREQGCLRVR